MKINHWKDLVELTGIVAIVASLVFVGLQLKQSQDIAIAEQYQNRSIAAQDYMMWSADNQQMLRQYVGYHKSLYESGDGGEVFNELFETQGPESLATNHIRELIGLLSFDNFYLQYQLGTLGEESWVAFRYRLKNALKDKMFRWAFDVEPQQWRESFRELCAEIIAEIEHEAVLTE